jgi:hypothetical protein
LILEFALNEWNKVGGELDQEPVVDYVLYSNLNSDAEGARIFGASASASAFTLIASASASSASASSRK